jgi:hypothetical protein
MPFISEIAHPNSRTWDPERDITLKYEQRMSGGTTFMQLTAARGEVLRFVMHTTFEPPVSGSEKPVIVRHVTLPETPLADFTMEQTVETLLKHSRGCTACTPMKSSE